MAKTIEQVLAARNLCGLIRGVVTGVPSDILPPSFLTPNKTVEGNHGTYTQVNGTRKTARIVQYGSPSQKRGLAGISEKAVTLLHTFEHQHHNPLVLQNLLSEDSEVKQTMGKQTVARQVSEFGALFKNLRISAVYSALAQGAIYFDADGNLLPTASGATVTVDYGVPAGNKAQLDVFGSGAIISASWATAGTLIGNQIRALKKAARKKTGYPIVHAFYGSSIPDYLLANTQIQALIAASPRLSEAAAAGDVPQGLCGLQWHPVDQAFYDDANDVLQDWFGADTVVFTPEPSPDWYEFLEGTYPVPNSLTVSADASAALGNVTAQAGPFSYAVVTDDPVGIKHLAGDTFLPVMKVPGAIFISDVTP